MCAQHCVQAVGDAISDAMFVEAVLTIKGWTIEQWAAMYTDLPRQVVCSQDVPVCLCALHFIAEGSWLTPSCCTLDIANHTPQQPCMLAAGRPSWPWPTATSL